MKIKNKNSIFTIATPSHLADALTALRSAKKYNRNVDCCLLYMDMECPYNIKSINVITLKDIEDSYKRLYLKYTNSNDSIRWSLKPVVSLYLLNFYQKTIYIDTDIYFVNNWNFLYDEIHQMILTPHYRCAKAVYDLDSSSEHYNPQACVKSRLYIDMTNGYFNAGFFGASKLALEPLRFWANCCYNKCEKNLKLGLYDDQKYLDIIYMMKDQFEDIKQIKNYGLNVAQWNVGINTLDLHIENLEKNKIWINKNLLIFLHLSKSSFQYMDDNKKFIFNYFMSKYDKIKTKIKQKLK